MNNSNTLNVSRDDLKILCEVITDDWVCPAGEDSQYPSTCRFCHKHKLHPWPDFEIRLNEHESNCPVLVAVSCQPNL